MPTIGVSGDELERLIADSPCLKTIDKYVIYLAEESNIYIVFDKMNEKIITKEFAALTEHLNQMERNVAEQKASVMPSNIYDIKTLHQEQDMHGFAKIYFSDIKFGTLFTNLDKLIDTFLKNKQQNQNKMNWTVDNASESVFVWSDVQSNADSIILDLKKCIKARTFPFVNIKESDENRSKWSIFNIIKVFNYKNQSYSFFSITIITTNDTLYVFLSQGNRIITNQIICIYL